MYLIGALLAAPRATPPLGQTSAIIADMVWLLAAADDGLEHVRARAEPHHITLVLFLKQESLDEAQETAWRMCRRLVADAPFLAGWRVHGCWPLDAARPQPPGPDDRP